MKLKDSKEENMGGFGERKEKKNWCNYIINYKNKRINIYKKTHKHTHTGAHR